MLLQQQYMQQQLQQLQQQQQHVGAPQVNAQPPQQMSSQHSSQGGSVLGVRSHPSQSDALQQQQQQLEEQQQYLARQRHMQMLHSQQHFGGSAYAPWMNAESMSDNNVQAAPEVHSNGSHGSGGGPTQSSRPPADNGSHYGYQSAPYAGGPGVTGYASMPGGHGIGMGGGHALSAADVEMQRRMQHPSMRMFVGPHGANIAALNALAQSGVHMPAPVPQMMTMDARPIQMMAPGSFKAPTVQATQTQATAYDGHAQRPRQAVIEHPSFDGGNDSPEDATRDFDDNTALGNP